MMLMWSRYSLRQATIDLSFDSKSLDYKYLPILEEIYQDPRHKKKNENNFLKNRAVDLTLLIKIEYYTIVSFDPLK